MSGDQLQFIDYRKPKLEAGEYVFSTVHRFKGKADHETNQRRAETLHVRVDGERIAIDDAHITSRYPPVGETGNFGDTLPHITFNKGPLPWTRFAFKEGDESTGAGGVEVYEPWLYLLVVNENDLEKGWATDVEPCRLGDLAKGAYFPRAQHTSLLNDIALGGASQSVNTVRLQKRLMKDLLLNGKNTKTDRKQLEYLAHIRRRWQEAPAYPVSSMPARIKNTLDNGSLSYAQVRSELARESKLNLPETATKISVVRKGQSWLVQDSVKGDLMLEVVAQSGDNIEIQVMSLKRESSVLVANRFAQSADTPTGEGRNIAMVISLERYIDDASFEQIKTLPDSSLMRFVVLTSWEFTCREDKVNFEERTQAIDANALKYADEDIAKLADFKAFLESGRVPLEHRLRNNDRSMSWYRGPIVPNPITEENWDNVQLTQEEMGRLQATDEQANETFVSTDADKLLRYFPEDGMLDATYSAAYELGRMLSLQQPEYLNALRQYKKQVTRHAKLIADDEYRLSLQFDLSLQSQALPYGSISDSSETAKREAIFEWLGELGSLSAVPLWYLLPDERLLPCDSLRTGFIDPRWIQALWLGALSIDGRPKVTYQLLQDAWETQKASLPKTAAFVRSDVLEAYPELLVKFRNLDESKADLPDGKQVNLKTLVLDRSSSVQAGIDLEETKRDFEDKYTDFIESHPTLGIQHRYDLHRDVSLFLVDDAFDYVSIELPAESLHYGADVDEDELQYSKSVKFHGTTIADTELPMTNASLGIINMLGLARRIQSALSAYLDTRIAQETHPQTKADLQDYQAQLSAFGSARIGRFMLEGEPKVEFVVGDEK